MVIRNIEKELKRISKLFPVVTVTGPRQSGKTTLVKYVFPRLPYVSLENPDDRSFAESDPRGFLSNYPKGAVFDEIQRVPELFSYIQGVVDEKSDVKFILTGSQNFLLAEKVSQTLAGRVGILKLLPFSMAELNKHQLLEQKLEEVIFKGFYPRIFDQGIPPRDFYSNYIQTYIERDVRQIVSVKDLNAFQVFIKLCAGRAGQLLNLSELSNDSGVAVNTIKSWLSILESSFILFRLYPHYKNFNKRLIKTPKLYFHDVGLLSYLLGITKPEQISTHFAKGALFENLVIADLMKSFFNKGEDPSLYFWQDHKGREIDLIYDNGGKLVPIEIKAGATHNDSFLKNLNYWYDLSDSKQKGWVIYGGDKDQKRSSCHFVSWRNLVKLKLE